MKNIQNEPTKDCHLLNSDGKFRNRDYYQRKKTKKS